MNDIIQKYINFYLHKITIKTALWQRYINSKLVLGEGSKLGSCLLADAIILKNR